MRTFLVVLCLLVGCTTRVSHAHAQEVELSDDARARALFDAGERAYQAGEYQLALELFERSRTLSGRAALLYNMGMCADRLRADDDAIRYFERYLAEAPDALNRGDVELRLEALYSASGSTAVIATTLAPTEAEGPVEAPGRAHDPTPHDPTPHDSTTHELTPGIAILAAGGAVALVGLGLLIGSAVDTATVENANNVMFASVRDAYERAPILSGVGWAALALGVGGAAIGTVLLFNAEDGEEALSLDIGPGSLRLEGSF